jgi:hypothetical protein
MTDADIVWKSEDGTVAAARVGEIGGRRTSGYAVIRDGSCSIRGLRRGRLFTTRKSSLPAWVADEDQ